METPSGKDLSYGLQDRLRSSKPEVEFPTRIASQRRSRLAQVRSFSLTGDSEFEVVESKVEIEWL